MNTIDALSIDLSIYESVEVQPVIEDNAAGHCDVTSDPDKASFWTVYGRRKPDSDGIRLADALVDCIDKQDADTVAGIIKENFNFRENWAVFEEVFATSLHENIAALSADLHTSKRYGEFYERFCVQLGGFPGFFQLAVNMATALTAFENEHGGPAIYEVVGLDWIIVVENFAEQIIYDSLVFDELADPAATLAKVIAAQAEPVTEPPAPQPPPVPAEAPQEAAEADKEDESFMDYWNAVDAAMMKLWGIDTEASGISADTIAEAQERGETAEEYAERHGEKYDLTPVGFHG
jgi:hypothetical protein